MTPMKRKLLAAVCGASLLFAGAAAVQAKTLVFCSEGSPEGFNPAFYTAGTTFDASSRAIFNRLVEFERGTTKIGPALGLPLAAFLVDDFGWRMMFLLIGAGMFLAVAKLTANLSNRLPGKLPLVKRLHSQLTGPRAPASGPAVGTLAHPSPPASAGRWPSRRSQ